MNMMWAFTWYETREKLIEHSKVAICRGITCKGPYKWVRARKYIHEARGFKDLVEFMDRMEFEPMEGTATED